MYHVDLSGSPQDYLPTMYDLRNLHEEEPGLPDQFHLLQPRLLDQTFQPPQYPPDQRFTSSALSLYFDLNNPQWYKSPDWFAVLGVPHLYDETDLRLSYVRWHEGVDPLVVIEFLSPETEDEDLGKTVPDLTQPPSKWEVYERILQVPYYVVFNRFTDELQAFQLVDGYYEPLVLPQEWLWVPELDLGLGLWKGDFAGCDRKWLRWFDARSHWILTPEERERQRAEQAEQELIELKAKLEAMGVELEADSGTDD